MTLIKRELDDWLDDVNYSWLNSSGYVPSEFALTFMNFIKLVNGEQGESNKTPPVHLKMLDKIAEPSQYIANLCFRGAAKALDVSTEILTTAGWSTIGKLEVGQQVFGEDGLPTTVVAKSNVFNKPMYRLTLKDGRTLDVSEDHINVIIQKRVKRVNGKCHTYYERREVTTKELLDIPLGSTRAVTASNPKGWENSVWIPCGKAVALPEQEYPIEPYLLGLLLGDGSFDKNTGYVRLHTHKEDLPTYLPYIPNIGNVHTDARNENVLSVGVLGVGKHIKAMGLNVHGDDKFIPKNYLHGSIEQRLALLQGLMDTDGTVNKATPCFASNSLRLAQGVQYLVYSLGGVATLTESKTSSGKVGYRVSINLDMPVFRLERKLVKATARVLGKVPLVSVTRIDDVPSQCIAVDNQSKTFLAGDFVVTHNTTLFMEYLTLYLAVFGYLPGLGDVPAMIYVSDSMDNGAKSARKNIEFRYQNSEFLQKWIKQATFTDTYLEFTNTSGHKLGVKLFGAKTGIRGTKVFGKRPVLCILDDLISDDDGKSKAAMDAIKDTVHKGVNHALDPTRRKVIFNGTPFNKDDVLIEVVESGTWSVNVWPVCERFPVPKEEFVGAWEDRFNYDYVKQQYDMAVATGKVAAFNQELMLRISSEEERLIQDAEIRWYSRSLLLRFRSQYNFYITTDFAVSDKQSADYTVISVWAYNCNGDWFWVDGIAERQTMDKTYDDLFRLVQIYKPQEVGIEKTGQQGGFITLLQREMMLRNIWFSFASSAKNGQPGIMSEGNKLTRLNMVVPWFKLGKMYWPEEMKDSKIVSMFMGQLRLATQSGIKGKDDCIDTISQLAYIRAWKPSVDTPALEHKDGHWHEVVEDSISSPLGSYIV